MPHFGRELYRVNTYNILTRNAANAIKCPNILFSLWFWFASSFLPCWFGSFLSFLGHHFTFLNGSPALLLLTFFLSLLYPSLTFSQTLFTGINRVLLFFLFTLSSHLLSSCGSSCCLHGVKMLVSFELLQFSKHKSRAAFAIHDSFFLSHILFVLS